MSKHRTHVSPEDCEDRGSLRTIRLAGKVSWSKSMAPKFGEMPRFARMYCYNHDEGDVE